jgi:hypothetical protein
VNLSTNEKQEAAVKKQLPDGTSFRSMEINANEAHVVVRGKRLLRSDQILVFDRETGEIIKQESVGLLARLSGGRL